MVNLSNMCPLVTKSNQAIFFSVVTLSTPPFVMILIPLLLAHKSHNVCLGPVGFFVS